MHIRSGSYQKHNASVYGRFLFGALASQYKWILDTIVPMATFLIQELPYTNTFFRTENIDLVPWERHLERSHALDSITAAYGEISRCVF